MSWHRFAPAALVAASSLLPSAAFAQRANPKAKPTYLVILPRPAPMPPRGHTTGHLNWSEIDAALRRVIAGDPALTTGGDKLLAMPPGRRFWELRRRRQRLYLLQSTMVLLDHKVVRAGKARFLQASAEATLGACRLGALPRRVPCRPKRHIARATLRVRISVVLQAEVLGAKLAAARRALHKALNAALGRKPRPAKRPAPRSRPPRR